MPRKESGTTINNHFYFVPVSPVQEEPKRKKRKGRMKATRRRSTTESSEELSTDDSSSSEDVSEKEVKRRTTRSAAGKRRSRPSADEGYHSRDGRKQPVAYVAQQVKRSKSERASEASDVEISRRSKSRRSLTQKSNGKELCDENEDDRSSEGENGEELAEYDASKLSDDKEFTLDCTIHNVDAGIAHDINAMLDTGSSDNWVSEKFKKEMKAQPVALEGEEKKQVYLSFTGKSFSATHKTTLVVECDQFIGSERSRMRNISFYILNGLARDMVIGKKTIAQEKLLTKREVDGEPAFYGTISKTSAGKKAIADDKERADREGKEDDAQRRREKKQKRDREQAEQSSRSRNTKRPSEAYMAVPIRLKQQPGRSRLERSDEEFSGSDASSSMDNACW